jgi:hypothetical protein
MKVGNLREAEARQGVFGSHGVVDQVRLLLVRAPEFTIKCLHIS